MPNPYSYENIIWADLETFSALNLRKVGSYRYAEDCEILLWAWALNDGIIHVWDVYNNPEMPIALIEALVEADTIGWHNGNGFDNLVIRNSIYAKFIEGLKSLDTMVQAYQHSLPGSLGLLSTIFSLGEDEAKDKKGKALVRLFCKPLPKNQKGYRATPLTHPKEWRGLIEYAKKDIISMRKLHKLMPKWNLTPFEKERQDFNLRMNDRGFAVDLDFCEKALVILGREKAERDDRTFDLTNGQVDAASKRDRLLKHLCEIWNVDLPDMQKATLERRLIDDNLPSVVKEIIRLRLESAATNTKKYQSFNDIACADGRVRGAIQHRGAFRTGRDAARLVQPQNMIRPSFKWPDIEMGIDAVKEGYYDLVRN